MLEELDLLAADCVLDTTSSSLDVNLMIVADQLPYRSDRSADMHVIKLD